MNTDASVISFIFDNLLIIMPLVLIEVALFIAAFVSILRTDTHKLRFQSKAIWIIISFVQIIGPILYFVVGRTDKN